MIARKTHQVIIPVGMKPRPSSTEISAAEILAEHFRSDVYFIERANYKTPDFLIKGKMWELKSPVGKGKYNIQHLLHAAIQQSPNIIVDARASKMHINRIKHELRRHTKLTTKGVKRLLLITKSGKVVVMI